jgi:hypothetical protein
MAVAAEAALAAFAAAPRNRRALFVTYGGGHVTKVAAVVPELERMGVRCLVIALTIGFKQARRLGLDPLGYRDFLHLVDREAVLEAGRGLLAGNRHPDVDEMESCCYLGVNYREWVDELGAAAAAQRYAASGRQGFQPRRFFEAILRELEPGVVVATSSPRSEQAAIEAAVALGVPSLTMVDLFAPPSDPFLRRPVHADRITVISQEVRASFIAAGLEEWRVVTTGSPDFDALFASASVTAGRSLCARLGAGNLRTVLWAGYRELEGPGVDPELAGTAIGIAVEKRLREWAARRSDVALMVRYHPSHYPDFPDQGTQERVYVSNPTQESAAAVLNAADVVIHQASTIGLEATLLRKRVLHLQFAPSVARADFDLASLGPSEAVASLDDLVPALERPASPPATRIMTVPQGPAAGRVAQQIAALLQSIT